MSPFGSSKLHIFQISKKQLQIRVGRPQVLKFTSVNKILAAEKNMLRIDHLETKHNFKFAGIIVAFMFGNNK